MQLLFGTINTLCLKKINHTPANYLSGIKMRLRMFVIITFICTTSSAQSSIAGTWQGLYLTASTDLGQPRLLVEIYDFKDSLFTGITHLYYDGNQYEHYKISGWYDKKDSIVLFREVATIAVDVGFYGNCLGNYTMILHKENNNLYQYGYWQPNIKGCTMGSQVWMHKKEEEIKKVALPPPPPPKVTVKNKPAPNSKPLKGRINTPATPVAIDATVEKPKPALKTTPNILPAKIAQRQTDVQSLLEIAAADKDSIRVDVYDNGEIDGDSVSVYQDNILRVNKKMITAKPITFYVSLDKNVNPITHLRMVAESLGSIPPCTALMIVTTKSKRYEVHLSSNFNTNATVELFLKE